MSKVQFPDPAEFTSRYEYSKSTSRYHFDNFADDDSHPPFKRIGRFIGNWSSDIAEMASATRANTYHSRLGARVPYLDQLESNDLTKMGLGIDHILHDKSVKKMTPTFQQMIDFFGFDKTKPIHPSFHIQKPGQVFIKHIDSCTAIRGNSSATNSNLFFEHPETIARFVIALEDWQLGHMWAYGNTYWKQWKAGEIVYHSWVDVPHATANASHAPRYTIQVTGYTTDVTLRLIDSTEYIEHPL